MVRPTSRHSFHSKGLTSARRSSTPAVVERFDATQRAQYVTTAPAAPTSANTTRSPSAVDLINARAPVNAPVRSVQLMGPQLLPQNAGAQSTTKTRSHPVFPLQCRLQESETISKAVLPRPDIQAKEAVSAPTVTLATVLSRSVYRRRVCLRIWYGYLLYQRLARLDLAPHSLKNPPLLLATSLMVTKVHDTSSRRHILDRHWMLA